MAGSDREAASRVAFFAALADHPHEYDFYQALRRLDTLFRDHPRLGRSRRPAEDPVRLCQEPSLAFSPATLTRCERSARVQPRLSVAFGGMFGPQGPLPLHLTEYARDRIINSADPTFSRFLDIFHHRMLSLVYRAWADAQPTVQFDRPESDRFAAYVGSLCGIGHTSLQNRDAMPDLAKLYFSGRLSCQARNPEGLQAMLAEFFRLPMRLVEFVGRWLRVPDDCRCVLAGQETGAAGRAEWGSDKRIVETHAFMGNAVNVWRLDEGMPCKAQIVPALIIHQDEHDVGTANCVLGVRTEYANNQDQQCPAKSGKWHRTRMLISPELSQQLKIKLARLPRDSAAGFLGSFDQGHLTYRPIVFAQLGEGAEGFDAGLVVAI